MKEPPPPFEILTVPQLIARQERMSFERLRKLNRACEECRGDEEYIVKASEFFADEETQTRRRNPTKAAQKSGAQRPAPANTADDRKPYR